MMRTTVYLNLVAVLVPATAFSQSATDKPTFDIASVRVSPRSNWVKTSNNGMQGGYLSGDRYEIRRATMLDLIRTAWNIDRGKIAGGPSWIDYDRYEVVAKAKAGTAPETLRLMLQNLLADRFGVVVHSDTRTVPAYRLVRSKGNLRLKSASGAGNTGCQSGFSVSLGGTRPPEGSVSCHGASTRTIAATLSKVLTSPVAAVDVLDATGLEGLWDLDLAYSDPQGDLNGRSAAISDGLTKLGLVLEKASIPQPILSVDKTAKMPTPDPPGAETELPSRPIPQFEVASVRLAHGEGGSRPLRFEPGGRVTANSMPPGILLQQGWNLQSYEQIVGLPKSFGSASKNVTIVAKAPEGSLPNNPGVVNAQARDMLNAMLRSLLIERYQMKFHFESRPIDGLTLSAGKPKLIRADPAGRTGCTREGQQPNGNALMVKVVCRNMTIAQFAEQMQALDTGILYPVHDETGLEGAWDFTINFDAMSRFASMRSAVIRSAEPPPDTNGQALPQAQDPSGSISFLDAVQKELGLRVETRKRPAQVLVIDGMLDEPTEN
jgi:uncharacterized protein (TIGR03435 family)